MTIEIRPGPLGVEGGEPFPEVREEMQQVETDRSDRPLTDVVINSVRIEEAD